jgi:hypothetical protein
MEIVRLSEDARENLHLAKLQFWQERGTLNKFWDVLLVFDDGLKVLASQRGLAIMSSFFRKMFDSRFFGIPKQRGNNKRCLGIRDGSHDWVLLCP